MVDRQEGMTRLVREFVDVLEPIVQDLLGDIEIHRQMKKESDLKGDWRDLLLTYRKAEKFLAIRELNRRGEKRKVYPDQDIADTRG